MPKDGNLKPNSSHILVSKVEAVLKDHKTYESINTEPEIRTQTANIKMESFKPNPRRRKLNTGHIIVLKLFVLSIILETKLSLLMRKDGACFIVHYLSHPLILHVTKKAETLKAITRLTCKLQT